MNKLVLLPGMDGTGLLFELFIQELGSGCDVQVISYPNSEPLGYAELEGYVRSLLPKNQHFVLLGESFSGPVAALIAASPPEGMKGLILCASFVRSPRRCFKPLQSLIADLVAGLPVKAAPLSLFSLLLMGRFATPDLKSTLSNAMSGVSEETLKARLKAVLSVDVSPGFATVSLPTLYLQAAHDWVVPASAAAHIQGLCPTVQVAPIKAPHFLLQTAPAEAASVVREFLHRNL